ncbi:MAG: hypothetical protein BWY75_03272 [bacterium ADurb.Bin425]|nr:MAG: hypothetical protein BWY75_03272 [bacterium ADurb.Bin425]
MQPQPLSANLQIGGGKNYRHSDEEKNSVEKYIKKGDHLESKGVRKYSWGLAQGHIAK